MTTEPTSGPSRSGMNPRRRSLATAWSATVVVVACLVGAGSARSTLPAYNGEIAFTTGTATVGAPFYAYWYTFAPGSEPEWPVAVSNPCDFDAGRPWGIGFVKDGGCVSLTNPDGIEPFYDVAPVWSPDGTELAFVRIPQGSLTGRLYTIGIDGSNLQQLTACETADAWLDWSSQGEIFYTCSDPGHTGAFLWPSGRASCGRPGASFSPDGTRIAYPHGVAMIAPAVAPLDPATGAPACPDPVIPSPLVAANAVAWSPDQRKLAIGNHDGVWVMNTNGTAIEWYWQANDSPPVTNVQWKPSTPGGGSSINVGPAYGSPETDLAVWGLGFAADETVTLTLRTCPTCSELASLGSAHTIAGGWFSVARTVPTGIPSGQYSVVAHGETSNATESASFSVLGKLKADPPYGPGGTILTLSGSGFAAGETVQFARCDSNSCIYPVGIGATTADASGSFGGVHVTLPLGTIAGNRVLAAYGVTSGGFAFTPITILASLELSAPSGGSTVFASGSHFNSLDVIDFLIFSCSPTCVYRPPAVGHTTVPRGSSSFANLPLNVSQPAGTYYVVALSFNYDGPYDSFYTRKIAVASYTKTTDGLSVFDRRANTSVVPRIVDALAPSTAEVDPLQLRRQVRAFLRHRR